jgi:hypothetical protein
MNIDNVPYPVEIASYFAQDYPVPDEVTAQMQGAKLESMALTDDPTGREIGLVRITLESGRRFLVSIGDITGLPDSDPFEWPVEGDAAVAETIDPEGVTG